MFNNDLMTFWQVKVDYELIKIKLYIIFFDSCYSNFLTMKIATQHSDLDRKIKRKMDFLKNGEILELATFGLVHN